jgi:hypothetical protein
MNEELCRRESDQQLAKLIGRFEMFEEHHKAKLGEISDKLDDMSDRLYKVEQKFSVLATVVKTLKVIGYFILAAAALGAGEALKLIGRWV